VVVAEPGGDRVAALVPGGEPALGDAVRQRDDHEEDAGDTPDSRARAHSRRQSACRLAARDVRFRAFADEIEERADEDVGAGADPERPVAAKPPARVLVGRRRTHQPGQRGAAVVELPHAKVVDRLREAGLGRNRGTLPGVTVANSITDRQNLPTRPSAISPPGFSPSEIQPPCSGASALRSRSRIDCGRAGVSPCRRWLMMSGSTLSAPSRPASGARLPTSSSRRREEPPKRSRSRQRRPRRPRRRRR